MTGDPASFRSAGLPLVLQIAMLWLIGIAGFIVCVDQLSGHHAPLPGPVPIPLPEPFPAN